MDGGPDSKLQSVDPADDPAFVALLRRGDGAAFERLVRDTTGRMLAVALRFLPEEADAQDAVQDAYLSAFRALPKFDGDSRLSTWLHRIVVNAALMKLRTRRRRPEQKLEDLLPRFSESGHHEAMPVFWHETPHAGIERQELHRSVRSAIHDLPEDFRDVILLRDIEQIDTRTAASMLGITESALKTRLHRARLALRTLLDSRLAGTGDAAGGTGKNGPSSPPPRLGGGSP